MFVMFLHFLSVVLFIAFTSNVISSCLVVASEIAVVSYVVAGVDFSAFSMFHLSSVGFQSILCSSMAVSGCLNCPSSAVSQEPLFFFLFLIICVASCCSSVLPQTLLHCCCCCLAELALVSFILHSSGYCFSYGLS